MIHVRGHLPAIVVGFAVTLSVLSACSGQGSVTDTEANRPSATSPSEISDRGTYDSDNEEMFSVADHSCDELKQWYGKNPGDSNVAIAEQYGRECEADPPPVLSGELSRDDLEYELPLDITVLNCQFDPDTLGDTGLVEVGFSNNSATAATVKITLNWDLYGDEVTKVRSWTVPAGKTDVWAPNIPVRAGTEYEGPPTCSMTWTKK